MVLQRKYFRILIVGCLFLITAHFWSCGQSGPNYRVSNVEEFHKVVKKLAPGDTITLANGRWMDADLVFEGQGETNNPIVMQAETPGKVTLEGKSRLRLGGEHLVVSGLTFVNGYTPGDAVIEFRIDSKRLANYSRVTNCVIDNYNQPDRFKEDNWVLLYGKYNRFDHNYLARKKNSGVTVVVKLNDPRNQENYHRIDHNFFGYRPRLGSNGGETLRIGVSTYSLKSSFTTVEENYFYRCNGETEVASIKSSDNYIRRNTFYECEGSMVMRHGDRNVVEDNFFIGNNRPETGGIRVINNGHKIYNNYLQGLKGERFRAALAVMNGVPNSLLNRYHKAKDCLIVHNTFIDCENIEFGVGSDFERTDVPENITVANNIFANRNSDQVFRALDDIGGFHFSGNLADTKSGKFRKAGFISGDPLLKKNTAGLRQATAPLLTRIVTQKFDFVKNDITGNLRPPTPAAGAQEPRFADELQLWATPENTGVKWYSPKTDAQKLDAGMVLEVAPRRDALYDAYQQSQPGDILELTDAATYEFTRPLEIRHPITIRAKAGLDKKPLLIYVGDDQPFSFMVIENGGVLKLQGVAFDGNAEIGGVAESAIRTSKKPMIEHYSLFVENCDFYDFQESRFNAFRAYQSTYADTVYFKGCTFREISGDAINLAAEKEDRGKYNAEYVILENCVFTNVMGAALDLYRGGNDESTFGPFLTVDHCVFDYVNNKEQGSVLRLIGVQVADIRNSIFVNSGRGGRSIKFEDSRWNHLSVSHCNLYNSGKIESFYDNVVGKGMMKVKPEFVNPEKMDFRLKPGSPLIGKGSDGKNIGLAL